MNGVLEYDEYSVLEHDNRALKNDEWGVRIWVHLDGLPLRAAFANARLQLLREDGNERVQALEWRDNLAHVEYGIKQRLHPEVSEFVLFILRPTCIHTHTNM